MKKGGKRPSFNMNAWEERHTVLSFQGKDVEFEDSRVVYVRPFRAIMTNVLICEWLDFAERTGYTTQAERDGRDSTFRRNRWAGSEETIGREEWLGCGARCISWLEASMFCRHYNVRMLTEAEWLVSSYLLHETDTCKMAGMGVGLALSQKCGRDNCIGFSQEEWTSDRFRSEAIVRTGPQYFRGNDWKSRKNFFTAPLESHSVARGFRVVLSPDK